MRVVIDKGVHASIEEFYDSSRRNSSNSRSVSQFHLSRIIVAGCGNAKILNHGE